MEDALCAASLGADAIGLVFYQDSPRVVDVELARAISMALPPFVDVVSLFVNANTGFIQEVIDAVRPAVLQFHGDEEPDDCSGFGLPYVKAIRMNSNTNLVACGRLYRKATGLLLDASYESLWGGGGQVFDWSLVPHDISKPIVLAGGLTPDNVAKAIATVQPYAVDVSGGVELKKGKKDADKMARFIEAVR